MSLIQKVGRELTKLYIKILNCLERIKGTSKSVAKGFATGVSVSFTPFVGFHLLIALFLCKLLKQNGVAASIGTIIGNPWTFPLIWYLTWHCGYMILDKPAIQMPEDFSVFFKELVYAVIMLDFKAFFDDIWPIFYPMLVGCVPFCVGIWWLIYKTLFYVLSNVAKKGESSNDTRSRMRYCQDFEICQRGKILAEIHEKISDNKRDRRDIE